MASESDGKLVISEEDLESVEEVNAQAVEDTPTATMPHVPPPPPAGKQRKVVSVAPAPQSPPAAAPQNSGSWLDRNRRKLLLAGGGVVVLALGFVVAFVILGLLDSAEADVSDSLADGNQAMTSTFKDIDDAGGAGRKFTALQEASQNASDSAADVQDAATEIRTNVDDGSVANPALALLADEQRFLTQFATISNFDDEEISSEWKDLEPKLRAAQADIRASSADVSGLGLDSSKPVVPAAGQLSASITGTDRILVKTDQVIDDWRHEVDRIQSEQNSAVSQAESYKGQMSSLIEQYYDQRDVTRDLMEQDHVLWSDAEAALRSQAADRESIISQMQALSPPPAAASAHSQEISLAEESRSLLVQAADTTHSDPYVIWTGSPGYQQLSAGSDNITGRFEPAKQAVLNGADQAIAEAQDNSDLPPKPKV